MADSTHNAANAAQMLSDRNTFTFTAPSGVPYLLRRFTGLFAVTVQGHKAFGMMVAAHDDRRRDELAKKLDDSEVLDLYTAILREGMVEPRLGDVFDADTNTVGMMDMGDDMMPVLGAIMKSGGGKSEDFSEPQ